MRVPPPHERLTLHQAGLLFDPPRTRRAVDQLIRRGVLAGWQIDGALYTTLADLKDYCEDTRYPARIHDPSFRSDQDQARIRSLEAVITEQAAEITHLRIQLALERTAA